MDPTPPCPRSSSRARARAALVSLSVLVCATLTLPPAAGAAEPTAPPTTSTTTVPDEREQREQRQRLEEDLEAATTEERRLAGELAAAAAERDRLQLLLADVAQRAIGAAASLEAAEVALGRANGELAAARSRLAVTQRALRDGIDELKDQAVDSFIVGGQDEAIRALTDADDMRELGAASTYRDIVLERQDAIVDRVERLKVERVRNERAAERAKEAADEAVLAAGQRRSAVEAEQLELEVLEDANALAVVNHATLLNDVQARKARYEIELAALVELSRSLNEALAARQVGQVVAPAAQGRFVLPIPTARMSSSFGPRIHPIFGTSRLHAGMDLAAPTGTPIRAAAPGVVVTAGWLGGYGNAVVVDHAGGLSTLYAHQSALAVTVGQVVAAGDVVGRVGSTGNSTGPHLHFEVRVLGAPVDPVNYL
ncbi:MAG: Membrane proteins related to metalloendopeptidases [uncultured Acidimicrobiales bacterium]|uniref:Membrane proteins related to metalloendopeptidases n=1 Tax=uncultured Acidimicrobiales bacterium TaxID=310071 RepID=A0A6J4HP94_9ACTN|nr:MAG: Membrane proteins related to metalloendopeptidases [uncultured Acidimicrobiales bacterium]